MSHYIKEELEIKDKQTLIETLGQLDARWKVENLEFHEGEGAHLIGYMGDERPERCHIIVRKRHVNRLSNDFGFVKLPNGNYQLVLDQYTKKYLISL